MTIGKQPAVPLYTVVDKGRPLPNFLIDRTSQYWSLLVFSTPEKATSVASRMMKYDPKIRLDFAIIQTEDEFRGILVALTERLPELKWVHQDPTESRRSPHRWPVKDLLNANTKG